MVEGRHTLGAEGGGHRLEGDGAVRLAREVAPLRSQFQFRSDQISVTAEADPFCKWGYVFLRRGRGPYLFFTLVLVVLVVLFLLKLTGAL